jgi:2-dehydro-3-deoxyphosphooctonate aldolase (KDO 8-P synthase)
MIIPTTRKVAISTYFDIGGEKRFVFIGGPCAIESEQMSIDVAGKLKEVCAKNNIDFVFKSSFDKANRSSVFSPRGVGMEHGLAILQKVKDTFQIPIITDVHESWQCESVGSVVDIIQIPAFLARQTDLLVAAAKTGKVVNIKKAQFMAPWDMQQVVNKMIETGNESILLTERGSSFGYNNLVVDMTSLIEMRKIGYPIVFDATHAVQKPGGNGTSSGGNRTFVAPLMRAALAVGVDAIFAEVHPNPDKAFSDAANQLHLDNIETILEQAIAIDDIIKN